MQTPYGTIFRKLAKLWSYVPLVKKNGSIVYTGFN